MNQKHVSTPEHLPAQRLEKENHMNRSNRLAAKCGMVLCSALLTCATYGQPSIAIGVSIPLPSVVIHTESDFYQPLAPHGEWVVIGGYGRCWRPARVEVGWRPYCNGYWQRSDAGWYWASDEPWAWATYHYGRWDFTDQYGWYWVPQIQWAPAWVSWHSGGGYIGWAPLLPAVRISASGYVGYNAALVSPRAYVFVEERRFMEPVRPTTVVVNNTTIINKTVIITNTKLVNNTVINEGPATTVIEKASGRKVQAVPVQELRHKQEATVVRNPTLASAREGNIPSPVPAQAEPRRTKAATPNQPPPASQPTAAAAGSVTPAPKNHGAPNEDHTPASAAPESRPEPRPDGNPPAPSRQPAGQEADKQEQKQAKPGKPSDKKGQQPAREKPAGNDKNESGPSEKEHGNKSKD